MNHINALEHRYSRGEWNTLLNHVFKARFQGDLSPAEVPINKNTAKNAFQLGEVKLADGNTCAVYEIALNDNINVNRNRVTIRNLLRKEWSRYDGALIASYKHTDPEWRFSFVSETREWNADGTKYVKTATEPKRFTYVLGENEKTKTPDERLTKIAEKNGAATLDDLKEAFSVETLTKDFYKELFGWYQWALSDEMKITFPNSANNEEHLIRLITRLMFVWFIKQKQLVPNEIFDIAEMQKILSDFNPTSKTSGTYYNAILQNLFFATLNRNIDDRGFASKSTAGKSDGKEHYGIKTHFRDDNQKSWFKLSHNEVINLFRKVPFLNGGLFECLDKYKNNDFFYCDGFSRDGGKKKRAFIPNDAFFNKDNGLISILERYNFTIEENTPNDADVALDPELLGKVFENLLGAYNPETKETVRKKDGSFYTPREIVNYMVDESLKAYLLSKQPPLQKPQDVHAYEKVVEHIFSEPCNITDNIHGITIANNIKMHIYNTLRTCKVLDPACGSGAFPMGILNRIIDIFKKLEPQTNLYETKIELIENCIYGVDIQCIAVQITKLRFFISLIVEQNPNTNSKRNYGIIPLPNLESKFIAANTLIGLNEERKDVLNLQDAELVSMKNELWNIRCHKNILASSSQEKDSLRKQDSALCQKIEAYLIKNTTKPDKEKIKQREALIAQCEKEIENLPEIWVDDYRQEISMFNEQPQTLFKKDINKDLRDKLIGLINLAKKEIAIEKKKGQLTGLEVEIKRMTNWDPYDQNASSPFFDAEWMFGLSNESGLLKCRSVRKNDRLKCTTAAGNMGREDGGYFDVVIGNPPYGGKYSEHDKKYFLNTYKSAKTIPNVQKGSLNTYVLFLEKAHILVAKGGLVNMIVNMSIVTSDSVTALHNILFKTCRLIQVSNYMDRPVQIFPEAHTKTSIIKFIKNDSDCKNLLIPTIILSTKLNRLSKDNTLENLINKLSFVECKEYYWGGKIPKISYQIEKNILKKIFSDKNISISNLRKEGSPIYYRKAGGGYYNVIANYSTTDSSSEGKLFFDSKITNSVGAILSSSLFWWFQQVYTDCFNLKINDIDFFTIPVSDLTNKTIEKLEKLYANYLIDIEKNANVRTPSNSSNYKIKQYTEYKIVYSKHLIDQIDDLICPLYGLTKEETEFIKNYEIEFRLSGADSQKNDSFGIMAERL